MRFSGKSLSYAELESRTNSLARLLIEQGVRRGDRVGIFMNKGLESAVAIYGIMKAGAAYVPLGPLCAGGAAGVCHPGLRHPAPADQRGESRPDAGDPGDPPAVRGIHAGMPGRAARPGWVSAALLHLGAGLQHSQPAPGAQFDRAGPGLYPLHLRLDRHAEGHHAHPPQRAELRRVGGG